MPDSDIPSFPSAGALQATDQLYLTRAAVDYNTTPDDVLNFSNKGLITDKVAGGAGFANATGTVTMDLAAARVFLFTVTGNITSLSFSNIPSSNEFATVATIVLRMDATGGYTIAEPADLVFRDGQAWADLDTTANNTNIVVVERVGTQWYAYLDNGQAPTQDPVAFSFQANGDLYFVAHENMTLDVGNTRQTGTGTVAFAKNGSAITAATAFAAGDVLKVTCSGIGTHKAVTIPRTA